MCINQSLQHLSGTWYKTVICSPCLSKVIHLPVPLNTGALGHLNSKRELNQWPFGYHVFRLGPEWYYQLYKWHIVADMSQHFIINLMYMNDMYDACVYIGSKCLENCAYHTFLPAALILEKSPSLGFPFLISAAGLYDLLYFLVGCLGLKIITRFVLETK